MPLCLGRAFIRSNGLEPKWAMALPTLWDHPRPSRVRGIRDLMKPLDQWRGAFGDAYTDRNLLPWEARLWAWRTMLKGLNLQTVLEVGCNRGANLLCIQRILPGARLVGVEPNAHAREEAQREGHLGQVVIVNGSAERIAFRDGNFDLVFTAGVLIHIPPEGLDRALRELYRLSRKWLLAVEYHADRETEIRYRNQTGLLWKRNHLQAYLTRFPDLQLSRSGYWGPRDGFDRCTWHLMEKV